MADDDDVTILLLSRARANNGLAPGVVLKCSSVRGASSFSF